MAQFCCVLHSKHLKQFVCARERRVGLIHEHVGLIHLLLGQFLFFGNVWWRFKLRKMSHLSFEKFQLSCTILSQFTRKSIYAGINLLSIHSAICPIGSFYVIMEYVPHGNLRKFLRKNRKVRDNMNKAESFVSNLSPSELLNFAIGVAKAMVHISSAGVRIAQRHVLC